MSIDCMTSSRSVDSASAAAAWSNTQLFWCVGLAWSFIIVHVHSFLSIIYHYLIILFHSSMLFVWSEQYNIYIYIFVYLYVHIYMYSHYICIMLIYTMFSPYPKTPPLEVAASTAKAKFESWKPSSVGVHPSGAVIGQCEKTTEDANEASCICILIYCICTMCFFWQGVNTYISWVNPVNETEVIVHVCSQVSP